jgi:outer membrane protein, heavy metal efflux system
MRITIFLLLCLNSPIVWGFKLSLTQAEQLLLEQNKDILIAKHTAEAAETDIETARQLQNPNLSVSTTNIKKGIGAGNPWEKQVDTNVSLSQLIERGNKRQLRKENAELKYQATQLDIKEIIRQQKQALFGAYYDLLFQQDKHHLWEENLKLYQASLKAAELRLKAGDISPTDLSRIRVDTLRAESDLQQSVADWKKAQLSLALLLDIKNKETLRASDHWLNPEQMDLSTPLNILQRPDIQAAQTRFEAAQKNFELTRTLQTRDVTISAQYDHAPPDNKNSFGIGVSVPLFAFYNYNGEIRRANLEKLLAKDSLEKSQAQAHIETEKTRTDLLVAAERLKQYQGELLKEARKAAQAAEFAYKHGGIDVTDLLDARRTLRTTELEALNAQADYAKAFVNWQLVISSLKEQG